MCVCGIAPYHIALHVTLGWLCIFILPFFSLIICYCHFSLDPIYSVMRAFCPSPWFICMDTILLFPTVFNVILNTFLVIRECVTIVMVGLNIWIANPTEKNITKNQLIQQQHQQPPPPRQIDRYLSNRNHKDSIKFSYAKTFKCVIEIEQNILWTC